MKISKYLAIISLVLILMFTGCSTQRQEPGVAAPFYGGSEGLIAEFEEIGSLVSSSGYPEVWEDQSFPLMVRLMNKGEHEVSTVNLVIKGVNIADFTGLNPNPSVTQSIEPVSEFLLDGGEFMVNFGSIGMGPGGIKGTFYDANFFVEYTYDYEQTVAVPKVCFKGNPYDDTICDTEGSRQAFVSGGPFQIGTVTQRPAGKGRIMLEIPVRNVAGGKAKAESSGMVKFSPLYDEIKMNYGGGDWECTAKGLGGDKIRINRNGETVVRCRYGFSQPIPEQDVYTSEFDLTLEYIYQDFVSETVRIRRDPTK